MYSLSLGANAQTADGTFTDTRDGQVYNTITIELLLEDTEIVLLAQNLNYEMPGSWTYNDDETYREVYGLLYTWHAAMRACPPGWHLPSDREWNSIVNNFGGRRIAGDDLKAEIGWAKDNIGTNISGFTALPGGYRTSLKGNYHFSDKFGYWWSSREGSHTHTWGYVMGYYVSTVRRFFYSKNRGLSVRCIQYK